MMAQQTQPLAGEQQQENSVVMRRLYNPNSGEHFYTADEMEFRNLIRAGWRDEGNSWKAPAVSKTPVFRLYNPNAGDHHYTLDSSEKEMLIKAGWRDEGIGWYSDDAELRPLYREYNPNAKAGAHNYTPDYSEHLHLISKGWRNEGTAWYGMREKPETPWQLKAVLSNVPAAARPIEVKGFFVTKNTDGRYQIYNDQGKELAKNYQLNSVIPTMNDELYFNTPEGILYFDYLAGLTAENQVFGGIGGVDNSVFAWDEENQKMLFGYYSFSDEEGNEVSWTCPKPETGTYQIYSLNDFEAYFRRYQAGQYTAYPEQYCIWNADLDTVSGPYRNMEGTYLTNLDFSYLSNFSPFARNFNSLYPLRTEDGTIQAAKDGTVMPAECSKAISADQNVMIGWNGGQAWAIGPDLNRVIPLGDNIRFATGVSDNKSVLVQCEDTGEWQIRRLLK